MSVNKEKRESLEVVERRASRWGVTNIYLHILCYLERCNDYIKNRTKKYQYSIYRKDFNKYTLLWDR